MSSIERRAKEGKPPDKAFGPKIENTDDLPMYFGYVLITVDGDKLSGEWRAFVNYACDWEALPDDGLERFPEAKPR